MNRWDAKPGGDPEDPPEETALKDAVSLDAPGGQQTGGAGNGSPPVPGFPRGADKAPSLLLLLSLSPAEAQRLSDQIGQTLRTDQPERYNLSRAELQAIKLQLDTARRGWLSP